MKSKTIIKAVEAGLQDFMARNGFVFVKKKAGFVLGDTQIEKRVVLTASAWTGRKSSHVDHYLQVRLNRVEETLYKYRQHVTPIDEMVTFSTYFFNIVPTGFDWARVTLSGPDEISRVIDNLEAILASYCFPYLARFSDVGAIERSFLGKRSEWLVDNPVTRFEVLLAMAINAGDVTKIDLITQEVLGFCGKRNDFAAIRLSGLASGIRNEFCP